MYSTKAIKRASLKKKKKKSGLNEIGTHDLCDTGAALLPIELASQLGADHLWVRYMPVDGEDMKFIYIYIFNSYSKHYTKITYTLVSIRHVTLILSKGPFCEVCQKNIV